MTIVAIKVNRFIFYDLRKRKVIILVEKIFNFKRIKEELNHKMNKVTINLNKNENIFLYGILAI